MPIYQYKAIDYQGRNQEGELEAANREDLAEYLNKKKLLLISLFEKKEVKELQKLSIFGGTLTMIDRQVLFEDLATMVTAGLPIADSIRILREDATKKTLKAILMDFQFTIEKGSPLSEALEHYPRFFSPVIINLIKAGEASGNLEKTLHVIADQFRKDYELRKKITSALIYPVMLLSLSAFVLMFMMIFVVPKLNVFFKQASIDLPLLTKIVIKVGDILRASFLIDGLVLAALVGFFIFISKTAAGKQFFFTFLARFPLTRKLFKVLSVYRYCWTMAILISSGVGILESIQITENVLASQTYKESMERMREKVAKGTSLGSAMKEEQNLFPQIVSGLTLVGEKTGNLQHIYLTLAKFYERTFSNSLRGLVKMMEPLLLLVMGGVIGGIAMAIVLPIYQFVAGVG